MVCLKGIFGLEMTAAELKIYQKFTGRNDIPNQQVEEAFLLIGRRGGKSFISALIAVFLAVFKKWNLGIEKGYVMVSAVDKRQAGIILNYVRKILELPVFTGMILNDKIEEIELKNNITIAVHTCSYRSLRGFACVAAILDELAFFRVEGANPSREILTALTPSLANIPGSLLLGISTGYSKSGVFYEYIRDFYSQENKEILIWKGSTQEMNPTHSKRAIKKALNLDPQAARAEYLAEFREDFSSYLSEEEVNQVVMLNRESISSLANTEYFAFTDPSGGKRDSMTLSICHVERDLDRSKIIQDILIIKKSPFNPESCVKLFATVLKEYGLYTVTGDKYGGEWVSSAFEKEGILYSPSEFSKSDIYLEARPLFSIPNKIEILDNQTQKIELRQLERRTGRGKDIVDHPPNLKDDASNSLCGSLVLAAKTDIAKTPDISKGLLEDTPQTVEEEMEKEAYFWLLNKKKKKKDPNEIDMDQLEKEIYKDLPEDPEKSARILTITKPGS